MNPETDDGNHAFAVAVIDGPYDAATLSGVLANGAVSLGYGSCHISPNSACEHGTFVMGLLGARQDALIPGLCPECRLLHIPLFVDENSPSASVEELATAIASAVAAGARLVNLSLAILGPEAEINPRLAAALDFAEASGALLLVAAGNQGRLAMGQLLSHPVVIPVAAVDISQRQLPESNFGPAISRRGVAALGRMPGYAPGGGTTVMSGTSVATAVATGILADVWSAHPDINGATLRSVVADLGPRNGSKPPLLDRDLVSAALEHTAPAIPTRTGEMTSYASLQGATTMTNGNGQAASTAGAGLIARPAPAGCGCGAAGGAVTSYEGQGELSGFVYAIGTIEADYPYPAIEREMQIHADNMNIRATPRADLTTKPSEDRQWQHDVLSKDRNLTRYLARQLRWRLTIEDFPVFVLTPSDPSDLDRLIDALKRPQYGESERRRGKSRAVTRADSVEIKPGFGPLEDLDVVIGVAGAQTPDGIAVLMDQTFPIPSKRLDPPGSKYFSQLADNHGLTDDDRAYNFLAARYPPRLSEGEGQGFVLSGVSVGASRLGASTGRIVRVIYRFKNDAGAERKYFVRVDVTHEFPMIVSPWQAFLERGEAS